MGAGAEKTPCSFFIRTRLTTGSILGLQNPVECTIATRLNRFVVEVRLNTDYSR